MKKPGMKSIAVLLLALAAAGLGFAQLRNKTYQPGELSAVAGEGVVVNRFGITPTSLQRPVGAFLLYVANKRGDQTDHFSLTLDKAGAAELLSIDTTPRKWRGTVLVDLQPGNYRLRLTKSPELSVAIQIQ